MQRDFVCQSAKSVDGLVERARTWRSVVAVSLKTLSATKLALVHLTMREDGGRMPFMTSGSWPTEPMEQWNLLDKVATCW